jgi:DNA-binding HxlR family transcriptional regulator
LSTRELAALFHHRWAAPALALLSERGGVRFVELQRRLEVSGESLRRALDGLIELGYVARNPG